MKKLLTLAVAAIFGLSAANAQTALIATLSHDGEITVFNGSGALIDAHKAAVAGDVITLSPGTFSATTISKAITIRGAGMFAEENGTNISGTTLVNAFSDSIGNYPLIEGLNFVQAVELARTKELTFSKCNFSKGLKLKNNYGQENLTFINSFIHEQISLSYNSTILTHTVSFVNTVVISPKFQSGGTSTTYSFENCYIDNSGYYYLYHSTVKNSIIKDNTSAKATSTCTLINNIILGNTSTNYFINCVSINNLKLDLPSDLWKDESRYVLNDQYAKEWLGSDGTQVGIYGGLVPFDPTPAGPQITKFNVGQKTSADGKLTVDIEVKTAN